MAMMTVMTVVAVAAVATMTMMTIMTRRTKKLGLVTLPSGMIAALARADGGAMMEGLAVACS